MSSSDNEESGKGMIIGALIALTLTILRVTMDMVQAAAGANDSSSSKMKKKTEKNKEKEIEKKGYGSIGGGGGGEDGVTSGKGNNDDATKEGDTNGSEAEPLLLLGDAMQQQQQQQQQGPSSNNNNNSEDRNRTYFFTISWICLTLVFIALALWGIFDRSEHPPYMVWLLVITSITFSLKLWLHLRDPPRDRYGPIHRLLQLLAVVILWTVYACLFWNGSSSAFRERWALAHIAVVIIIMIAMTAGVVLSLLDGAILTEKRKLHLRERRESKVASHPEVFVQMLRPYFWPDGVLNKIRAITTWICVLTSKGCGLISPLFLGWATTALAHADYRLTIYYSCLYCLVSFIGTTLKECQSLVYLKVAQAAFVQLSRTAFGHLHSLSLDWHLRKKLGETLRAMDRGIAACDTLMKYLFLWLVPAFAECLTVVIIFATYFDYIPLALTVFYFVFGYVFLTIIVTLWRKKFRKALVKSDNEYHDIFTDSMVNFEMVKHFTAEEFERERFSEAVSRYQAGSVSVQASLSFLNVSQQIILKVCLAVALSLSALAIQKRGTCCVDIMGCESTLSDCCLNVSHDTCPGMQVGDFVAVLTYTLNLFAPLNFLGSVYNAVVMAIVDLQSMSELLAEQPDVVDSADAIDLPHSEREDDIAVEFDNVFFHYPTQPSSNGLQGLSFKMKRGTTTAVVGPTGAGKTTVSRLLFRFYDVLDGAVRVNGVDVRDVKQKSLRGAIGVVPQAASMFNDTIRYNLKYGNREANQNEIEKAASDAQILNFITSLDDGWEALVGDRGLKLSGGEKQRVAIARCLLKNPPFVILDEATSALDTITERSVQGALDRLVGGHDRTVLVIAHRLGTIRNADNIIVLKEGRVAEQGSHDQLLAKNGVYADMWNMQLHHSQSN